jgi:hypothetical protein
MNNMTTFYLQLVWIIFVVRHANKHVNEYDSTINEAIEVELGEVQLTQKYIDVYNAYYNGTILTTPVYSAELQDIMGSVSFVSYKAHRQNKTKEVLLFECFSNSSSSTYSISSINLVDMFLISSCVIIISIPLFNVRPICLHWYIEMMKKSTFVTNTLGNIIPFLPDTFSCA